MNDTEEREPSADGVLRSTKSKNWRRNGFAVLWAVVLAAIIYVLVLMPTPYVVYLPGGADVTRPFVHTHGKGKVEKGALMLTYVNSNYPNWLMYGRALMNRNAEIMKKKDFLRKGQSQQEYYYEQKFMMRNSQANAIQVVYHNLKIPYHIKSDGVIIIDTENTPAGKFLTAGDEITTVDGKTIMSRTDILKELAGKKVGDQITLTYKHGDKTRKAKVRLVDLNKVFPDSGAKKPAKPRPGIGIGLVTMQDIVPDDPADQVTVDVGNIIGPSAGTMIALEIYNQLTPGDLTKGYRIAGTGEIDPEGHVGVIGGIQQKVVAADRAGAEIFFAPKDLVFPDNKYPPIRNYSDALAKAKQIGTKMKIVPIGTFDDAVRYLQQLPPKSGSGSK